MYKRERDVNYKTLKRVSTDEIVQKEAVYEGAKALQCLPYFSSCISHQPAKRLHY
jgi:hypothetical protein